LLILSLGCFALAVGLDFIEGLQSDYDWIIGSLPLSYRQVSHFVKVLEEFIEMVGTTLFLICFLKHFISISPVFSVRFK